MSLIKIVSGGQTGVDRAALDFALSRGFPCGGWCPKGRQAEDGPINEKYPLTETSTFLYAVRTKLNVNDSDGTLILYHDEIGNGTQYTAEYARSKRKPLLMINLGRVDAPEQLREWICDNSIGILNIAGPRESTSPGIYQKALDFLKKVLDL
ncbi:MAG: putative molybdenum carrier protein [bacterium]